MEDVDDINKLPLFVDSNYKYQTESGDVIEYQLNTWQKIFVTMTDEKCSKASKFIINFLRLVTLTNVIVFIVSWQQPAMQQPDTCAHPVCKDDPDLCPDNEICAPIVSRNLLAIQAVCALLYTIDHAIRVASCWSVPARIAKVLYPPLPSRYVKYRHNTERTSLWSRSETATADSSTNNPIRSVSGRDSRRQSGLGMLEFVLPTARVSRNEKDDVILNSTASLEDSVLEDVTYIWPIQTLRYFTRLQVMIDFLSGFPLIVAIIAFRNIEHDVNFINIVRTFQLVKLVELQRSRRSIVVITHTIVNSYKTFIFMFWWVLIIIIISSSILFTAERGEYTVNKDYPYGEYLRWNIGRDEKEVTPFRSISVTMWYSLVTLTTVGYGDFYPTSDFGRATASILIFLSVIVLALPISVIGNNFSAAVEIYHKEKKNKKESKALLNRSASRKNLVRGNLSAGDQNMRSSNIEESARIEPSSSLACSDDLKSIHQRLKNKFEEYNNQLKVCSELRDNIQELLVLQGELMDSSATESNKESMGSVMEPFDIGH